MPCLIVLPCLRGDAVEHYFLIISKLFETIERGSISLGSPDFTILFESGNDAFHKIKQGIFMRIAVELVNHSLSQRICSRMESMKDFR